MKKHLNIPIFIPHIGCPNDCVFCNQRKISGHTSFDPNSVKQELDAAFSTVTGEIPAQIAYFGGSFTGIDRGDMIFLLKTAKDYIDMGKCDSIRISTRPDYISPDILDILKEYHVKTIELGVQSMDNAVLRASHRGHTAKDTETACSLIKAYGFELIGQMMTGLPASSKESEVLTAQRICEMGADGARIYPTAVFADTELYDMAKRDEYIPFTTEEAVKRSAAALSVFLQNNIPVIRIGLQASELLTSGEVLGGYHPAMGEMIYARCHRDAMENALKQEKTVGRSLILSVHPTELSAFIGQKGANRSYLTERFSLKSIKFIPDPTIEKHRFQYQFL